MNAPATILQAVPAYITGHGQNDTHAQTLSDGRPNPHKSAGTPYDTITGPEIAEMVANPPSVPKEQAQWFIPSDYHAHDGRNHAPQHENGAFWWLALDVDQNNLALDDIRDALSTVLGPCSTLIYSTRSATSANRKWRALVRLQEPVAGADYSDTAAAFYDLLEERCLGVLICDRRLQGTGQLVYLPNRGEHYEHQILRATPLALTDTHQVIQRREQNRAIRAQAEAEAMAALARKAAQRLASGLSNATDPSTHFNQSHSISDLLDRYGYKRAGHSKDWRSPMQQSGSYATRDYDDHWISLSGSDDAAEIGAMTKNGHRHGDAFDLYVYFEHQGDFTAAVRSYAQEAGINRDTLDPSPLAGFEIPQTNTNTDKSGNSAAEGPQPLIREMPKGEPYPVQALGPLRGAVEAAQDISQAPIAIAAQSALSVAALAVQSFANVATLGGSNTPVSLYCLTIAVSGERKSSADKLLMAGLSDYEREQSKAHREEQQSWKNAQAIWKADHDKIMGVFKKGKGNRTAAQADLDGLGAEPPAPLVPYLTATEPTLAGLHKFYAISQPSLGVFSNEGGQFLGGHAMNSENRLSTIAGLSDLWGGEPIKRTRAGDGTSNLLGRRLSMHLMVQPVAARPLLADPVASGQGFLARFLVADPPSAIGTRLKRDHAASSKATLAEFSQRLQTILHTPKPTADDDPQELRPRELPLSQNADELLWRYYELIEREQAPGGKLCHLTAFASKSPEQAARIAGVLTLWADLNAPEVTSEAMTDAIELADFYLGEARRLGEAAVISAETEMAEKLRLWLLNDWPTLAAANGREANQITPSDIVQFGPNALRETETVKKHLKTLIQHGWLKQLPTGIEIGGKARKWAFQIVGE